MANTGLINSTIESVSGYLSGSGDRLELLRRMTVIETAMVEAAPMRRLQVVPTPEVTAERDYVVEFWQEIAPQLTWDLVPRQLLHELYVAWLGAAGIDVPIGRNTFYAAIYEAIVAEGSESIFVACDPAMRHRPRGRMDAPEPLLARYGLTAWADDDRFAHQGFVRRASAVTDSLTGGAA